MTATDELRRLLDERGVKHLDTVGITEYRGENDRTVRCYARPEPMTLDVTIIAAPPEQAVEATLGRGTCENVGYYIDSTRFKCSACGYNGWTRYAAYGEDRVPNYCPNCGRKVVDE